MKKIFTLLAVLTIWTGAAKAQEYNWGIGLRGGGIASGLDARINFDPANSLEMILSCSQGISLYGLYERQVPVFARGWTFYYGAGGHAGTWSWGGKNFSVGVDVIAGLEYAVRKQPVAFSLDYKPVFNFTSKQGFKMADVAISARYTF
ncbi:MAG: hypothetical protein LBU95_02565 [Rikenellaceae bacterium]|nr:hypothetical protein [Rikenellaceae bacterium]